MRFSDDSFKKWYDNFEISMGICPTSLSPLYSPIAYLSFAIASLRLSFFASSISPIFGVQKKTLAGAGRKPFNELVENKVVEWIYDRREKHLSVSRVLIMKKAKAIYDELPDSQKSESFVASRGWLEKFMRRHRPSLRRRTSIGQKDPQQLINRLMSYVIHARRMQMRCNFKASQIYAMDETSVWQDMVGTTTVSNVGSQDVVLKSTGHEKVRVSVCLTARTDGTK